MTVVQCPSCGQTIEISAKKSGLPWVIGCLVAVVAIPVVLGILGILAALAIPAVSMARHTAQMNACLNNMRQIDAAKEQWALERGPEVTAGGTVDVARVNAYLVGSVTPECPADGTYTYREIGSDPECSMHGRMSAPVRLGTRH